MPLDEILPPQTDTGEVATVKPRATCVFTSLLELLYISRPGPVIRTPETENDDGDEIRPKIERQSEHDGFESTMEGLLPDYLEARRVLRAQSSGKALPENSNGARGTEGESLRALFRFESTRIMELARQRVVRCAVLPSEYVALRKLQLPQERRREGIREPHSLDIGSPTTLTPLSVPLSVPIPHAVLDPLRAIDTTQYEPSFRVRVYRHALHNKHGLIAVDWEPRAPWSLLHAHYTLVLSVTLCTRVNSAVPISSISPERDQSERPRTPITYVFLQSPHLSRQEPLAGVFWEGIDVSDALRHAPESCPVVAVHGHLVDAALLSPPQETYITYLAVRV